MAISWGTNRTFGVFLEPMLNDFGWTRAQVSMAFTLNMFVQGGGGIAAGWLTDRFGPRRVLIGCAVLLSLGYIGTRQIQTIGQFYFLYGIVAGLGMSGAWVTPMSVITRWFVKRRAIMSGIGASGPALGIVVMPLLSTWFIEAWGWRTTYLILGVFIFLGIFLASLFLRRDPGTMGLMAYGAKGHNEPKDGIQSDGIPFREAWKTLPFGLMALICFCDLFLINVMVVHLVPHAIQLNISPFTAAGILAVSAAISIPGRILMGWLADRITNRRAFIVCLSMSVGSIILLLLAKGLWSLYLFSGVYALGLWTTGTIMSPITADIFGLKSHGSIFSFLAFAGTVGGGVGPVLVGYTFDLTGTYQVGFFLCLGISLIALAAVAILRPIPGRKG